MPHGFANSHEHYWSWIGIIKNTLTELESCGRTLVNGATIVTIPALRAISRVHGLFATAFILRAQHERDKWTGAAVSFEWLYFNAGGRTGAFYEEILSSGVRLSVQDYCHGLLRKFLFIVHHMLGIKFKGDKWLLSRLLYKTTHRSLQISVIAKDAFSLTLMAMDLYYMLHYGIKVKPDNEGCIEVPRTFVSGAIKIFTINSNYVPHWINVNHLLIFNLRPRSTH